MLEAGRFSRETTDEMLMTLPPSDQVLGRFLGHLQQPQHIGVEHAMEQLCGNRLKWRKFVDTRIVDQNMRRAERFDGFGHQPLHVFKLSRHPPARRAPCRLQP